MQARHERQHRAGQSRIAKGVLGQREEWLPYYSGTLKRAARKQLQADIDLYRGLLQQYVAVFDRIVGEMISQARAARS